MNVFWFFVFVKSLLDRVQMILPSTYYSAIVNVFNVCMVLWPAVTSFPICLTVEFFGDIIVDIKVLKNKIICTCIYILFFLIMDYEIGINSEVIGFYIQVFKRKMTNFSKHWKLNETGNQEITLVLY